MLFPAFPSAISLRTHHPAPPGSVSTRGAAACELQSSLTRPVSQLRGPPQRTRPQRRRLHT
eukprot:3239002-Prymnesium_polylepis.2